MLKTAKLSDCQKYRFSLIRVWDESKPTILFIGLNPSTADAEKDDPTIKKLITYTKAWGYGGFEIVNLFAFRSSDPKYLIGLNSTPIAVGSGNANYLKQAASNHTMIVCMWGNQAKEISETITELWAQYFKGRGAHCFKLNRDGSPAHPLYLPGTCKPIKFG
jgi:hypothetical protein